ncbi:MAG: tetratricopeptide repeat protein [Anaerolineae bacterium]
MHPRNSHARLHIQTLGDLQLWRDNESIPPRAWKTRKTRTLFAILLTYRNRVLSQDQLIEWVWPDLTLASARNSLQVAISHLRRVLEPKLKRSASSRFVLTEPPGYRLDTSRDCWVDADEFEAHYRRAVAAEQRGDRMAALACYQEAAACYRGDYLPEEAYADWAIAERDRLCDLYLDVLERQAQLLLDAGDFPGAIQACHQILARDPWRERIYRRLMRYYYLSGDRAAALAVYDRCRQILADELGVEPLAQTQALREAILNDTLDLTQPRPSSRPGAFDPVPALRSPFMGRQREMAILREAWERVLAGQPQFVLISGVAGIGKSRLLAEFRAQLVGEDIRVLQTCSYEMERSLVYRPVLELVNEHLPQRPRREILEHLGPFLSVVSPLLPHLHELHPNATTHHPLPPEQERQRVRESLAQCLRLTVGHRPAVCMFEDLQWADSSTLDLLQYAVRSGGLDVPHLFVATYRPEEVERGHPIYALRRDLYQSGLLTEIIVSPLLPGEVTALVGQLAGSPERGLRLGRRLFDETSGNPFYLIEILRALFQAGVIWVDSSGRWRTDYDEITENYQELMLPVTVREVILDRVARLDRNQQEWLAAAAAIGRPFDFELLRAVTGAESDALLTAVETWERRQLIRERTDGRYDFDHDKIREVLYQKLSSARRKRLHARVAESLEQLSMGAVEDLARHCLQAEVWDKALTYHIEAGRRAANIYAFDQALDFFTVAQSLAERLGDRAALANILIDIGGIFFLNRNDEAVQQLRQGLAIGNELLDRTQQARAVHHLARLLELRGDFDAALAYLRTCEHFLETTPAEELSEDIVRVYDMIGWMHRRHGDYQQALDHARRGLDIVRQRSLSPSLERTAVGLLEKTSGMTYWSLGEPRRALQHLEHSLAVWRQVESTHYMGLVYLGDVNLDVGTILYHLGEFDSALDHLEEAVRCHQRVGDIDGIALFHNNAGLVHYARAEYDQALVSFQEALRLCEQTGSRWYQPETCSMLALTHLALGHAQEALNCASRALEIARELGSQTHHGFAHRALGEVYAARDEGRDQAVEHFERSIALLEEAGAYFDLALAYLAYGRALRRWGQTEQGERYLHRAREIFTTLGCGQAWLKATS